MKKVSLPDQGVAAILGDYDENLKYLEQTFGVNVSVRGGEFTVNGPDEGEALVSRLPVESGHAGQGLAPPQP